jgi:hypothetical protein
VQDGHVAGGRVFGYRKVHRYRGEDAGGNPLKSHTERVIDEAQAAVVRRIFDLYGASLGHKRIARLLNEEGAPSPTPFVRKDPTKVAPVAGWAPATVQAILKRELHRGVAVWNRSQKRTDWGEVEHLTSEDTREADYGTLARAQARLVSRDVKGLRPQRDSNPRYRRERPAS